MTQIKCIVVTPETTVFEDETDAIVLPLYDGETGILPGHSPMIGRLGYGEMRLGRGGGGDTGRYYLDGGFVQVADNVVSVLTNRAIPAGEVDGEAARKQLEEAMKQPSNTPELMEIRERSVNQARAQIRVASR